MTTRAWRLGVFPRRSQLRARFRAVLRRRVGGEARRDCGGGGGEERGGGEGDYVSRNVKREFIRTR